MSWKIWKWTAAKHNAATFHVYELSNPSFQKHLLQINVCSVFATDVLLTETLKQTAYSHSKTKETLKGRLVFQKLFFGGKMPTISVAYAQHFNVKDRCDTR